MKTSIGSAHRLSDPEQIWPGRQCKQNLCCTRRRAKLPWSDDNDLDPLQQQADGDSHLGFGPGTARCNELTGGQSPTAGTKCS